MENKFYDLYVNDDDYKVIINKVGVFGALDYFNKLAVISTKNSFLSHNLLKDLVERLKSDGGVF